MKMKPAAIFGFRPEIEGLRGIAVLLVVLFHAGLPWMPGGFVGVDVFFVISGYLITGLLLAEYRSEGRISISAFYARRARRLLPGLLAMLIVCMVAAPLLLAASGERQAFAVSVVAALGFASNFFFWRTQSGYFADSADTLPLLHTWTLAVEEQFYLVWPLLILGLALIAWRKGSSRGWIVGAFIALAGLVSFAISLWATHKMVSAAFYLAPARAWEFAAGALLAVFPPSHASIAGRIPLATMGLAAIGISALVFNGDTQWPGTSALLPVLGAAAVIAGGQLRADDIGVRLLRWQPLRKIGAISYSWYLWHWPLLAFLSVATLGEAGVLATIVVVLASLLIAAASHHFVEMPVRLQRFPAMTGVRPALGLGAAALAATALLTIGLYAAAQTELRNSPSLLAIQAARQDRGELPAECSHYRYPFAGLSDRRKCRIGDPAARDMVVVWGDSHAHHLLPMLDVIARGEGFGLIPRTRGGCRPFNGALGTVGIGRNAAKLGDCASFNASVAAEFSTLADEGAKAVLIASRWPPAGESAAPGDSAWKADLAESIRAALNSGMQVVLAADLPSFSHEVPACLSRRNEVECERTSPDARHAYEQAFAALEETAAQFGDRVRLWNFAGDLCGEDRCRIRDDNGAILFRDSHHLSVRGALFLADRQAGFSPFADPIELTRK